MWLNIGLWALARFKALWGALASLKPATLLIIAVCVVAGLQTWRLGNERTDNVKLAMHSRVMTTAMRETNRRIIVAVKRNNDAAIENKRAVEARQELARKQSDERLQTIRADYRRRSDDYIKRMRTTQAAYHIAKPGNMPGSSKATQGIDGTGDDPFVLIPRADVLICADNTARLVEARSWALNVSK